MALHKINRGRRLPIEGEPDAEVEKARLSKKFALLPPDFEGVKFKLEVNEGDAVKVGTPLLSSRANPDMVFTSPAGGKVTAVSRGEKRRLLEIVVEADDADEEQYVTFEKQGLGNIPSLSRGFLVETLLASGLWPYLIQRPFGRIADPSAVPKSIFVNAMDTEPNCADKQVLLQNAGQAFQAGLEVLRRLTEGKVFLCYDDAAKTVAPCIATARGVEIHQFRGAHPTGNTGTHIHVLDPISKGDVVWTIKAEHLAVWGRFFLEGRIPVERVVAVAGSQATRRKYYKTRVGAPLEDILQGHVKEGETRVLNGGVLTGKTASREGYLGWYNSTVTFIPEGRGKELFGWMKPGLDKSSFSRLFFSSSLPKTKKFVMNTKLNGERRAIVATHIYDPLVTLDVYTNFLVKACIVKDVERMEELGLLECAPEDFALCTYACVSKVEVDSIIKEGLQLMEKES